VVLNQSGQVVNRARIATEREAVTKFFPALEGPVEAALEATGNWF